MTAATDASSSTTSSSSTTTSTAAEVEVRLRHDRTKALLRSLGRIAVYTVITLGIVLILWQCVVSFSGLSSYVGKGPADVYRFMFVTDPSKSTTAAEH